MDLSIPSARAARFQLVAVVAVGVLWWQWWRRLRSEVMVVYRGASMHPVRCAPNPCCIGIRPEDDGRCADTGKLVTECCGKLRQRTKWWRNIVGIRWTPQFCMLFSIIYHHLPSPTIMFIHLCRVLSHIKSYPKIARCSLAAAAAFSTPSASGWARPGIWCQGTHLHLCSRTPRWGSSWMIQSKTRRVSGTDR